MTTVDLSKLSICVVMDSPGHSLASLLKLIYPARVTELDFREKDHSLAVMTNCLRKHPAWPLRQESAGLRSEPSA